MSLTKYEADRLRGLITHHVQMQRKMEMRGAQPPEEAARIIKDSDRASDKLNAYIRKITKETPNASDQTNHADPSQAQPQDGTDRVGSNSNPIQSGGMDTSEVPIVATPVPCPPTRPKAQLKKLLNRMCEAHFIQDQGNALESVAATETLKKTRKRIIKMFKEQRNA